MVELGEVQEQWERACRAVWSGSAVGKHAHLGVMPARALFLQIMIIYKFTIQ